MKKSLLIVLLLVSVQPLWAQNVTPRHPTFAFAGTLENPIVVCHEDTLALKLETLMLDQVIVWFLMPGGGSNHRRPGIAFRTGGRRFKGNLDGEIVEEEVVESPYAHNINLPLNLQPFLEPGMNFLRFFVKGVIEGAGSTALAVWIRRLDADELIRLLYVSFKPYDPMQPLTDLYIYVDYMCPR